MSNQKLSYKQLEFDRFGLPSLCEGANKIGIELGVASGDFSAKMVRSGQFSCFFGVDRYADHHTTAEYLSALSAIGIMEPYKLLRMSFDEALNLFDDEMFDFVYIDGYAHNGEEGGRTISCWLSKVKVGGILAGHDYHDDWPLVVEAVDDLVRKTGFDLMLTKLTDQPGPQDSYPSWAVFKARAVRVELSDSLQQRGRLALHPISAGIQTGRWHPKQIARRVKKILRW